MKRIANPATGAESSVSSTLVEFRAVLARVTDQLDRGDSTYSATAPLALFIQERVGCAEVSFWSLLQQGGQAVMSRIGGHDAVRGVSLDEPLVQPASEFNLRELADSAVSIVPLPAAAMATGMPHDESFFPARIDVAIAANGETFGIIRCEFDEPARAWKLAETTLLRSFAGEIALRRARRRARRS